MWKTYVIVALILLAAMASACQNRPNAGSGRHDSAQPGEELRQPLDRPSVANKTGDSGTNSDTRKKKWAGRQQVAVETSTKRVVIDLHGLEAFPEGSREKGVPAIRIRTIVDSAAPRLGIDPKSFRYHFVAKDGFDTSTVPWPGSPQQVTYEQLNNGWFIECGNMALAKGRSPDGHVYKWHDADPTDLCLRWDPSLEFPLPMHIRLMDKGTIVAREPAVR